MDALLTRRAAFNAGLEVQEYAGNVFVKMPGQSDWTLFTPLETGHHAMTLAALAGVSIDNRPGRVAAVANYGRGKPAAFAVRREQERHGCMLAAIVNAVAKMKG